MFFQRVLQFPAKESLPYPVYVQKLGSEFWNPGKSLVTLEVTLTLRQVTRNIPGILLVDKTTLDWSITWPGTSFGGLSYDVICEVAGMDEPPMSRLVEWEKGRKRGFQTLTKKL
uniref:Uncharacterized protein n=1 Tax=Vespula pensylvanica TaxID=30213 RepID=A0A834U567_VESPE|nr:hypothetical protein H0235_011577 [Vespula pensylvanica]